MDRENLETKHLNGMSDMSAALFQNRCPGLYCGRILLDPISNETATSWSDCGACPRGYRVSATNEFSQCFPCENYPSTYDWMYLGFMGCLPLILHWFFIDLAAKERWYVIIECHIFHLGIFSNHFEFGFACVSFTKEELILHISAFFEVAISALVTILMYEPIWSLQIYSCEVTRLADWYTLFHNPTPNYEEKLHCTQEAVYPL